MNSYTNRRQNQSTNLWQKKLNAFIGRIVLCGIAGLLFSGLYVIYFAPKDFLKYPVDYFFGRMVIEGKKVLSTPIKDADVYALVVPQFYMQKQSSYWYWTLSLFAVFSAGAFVFSVYILRKTGHRKGKEIFHRGSQLLSPKTHNRLMTKTYKKDSPTFMGKPLAMGKEKVIIPESLQYQHFAFLGASGYGKSTAIEDILLHAKRGGQRCLVMDLGGTMHRKFGAPHDYVLSLNHPETQAWDFWNESDISRESISAALIEERSNSHPFFTKAARALMASLLEINQDISGILADLQNSNDALKKKLKSANSPVLKILGEGASEQTDGIIATVATELPFLKQILKNRQGKIPFSLSHWVKDSHNKSWVFLIVKEGELEQCRPLFRLWFDIACLATLKRDATEKKNDHLWLILDEVKSLGFLPSLPAILDKGRKYKSSVVLGFQAIAQLHSIYGANDAASILQGLQNQFFFRMGEQKCAEYASTILGNEDIEQSSYSTSISLEHGSERDSISHSRTRRPLVIPEQLRNLPPLNAYAKLAHHHPCLMSFQPKEFIKEELIPELIFLEETEERPAKKFSLPFQKRKT